MIPNRKAEVHYYVTHQSTGYYGPRLMSLKPEDAERKRELALEIEDKAKEMREKYLKRPGVGYGSDNVSGFAVVRPTERQHSEAYDEFKKEISEVKGLIRQYNRIRGPVHNYFFGPDTAVGRHEVITLLPYGSFPITPPARTLGERILEGLRRLRLRR